MEQTPLQDLIEKKTKPLPERGKESDFAIKYRPETFDDFIGNPEGVKEIRNWIETDVQNSEYRVLLLFAPPGVGKSLLLDLIKRTYHYPGGLDVLNVTDKTDADVIDILNGKRSTRNVLQMFSDPPEYKSQLLLIDDVDTNIAADKDYINKLRLQSREQTRIICTVPSNMIKKMNKLKYVKNIQFQRIGHDVLHNLVTRIVRLEKKRTSYNFSDHVYKQSNGDIRATLKNLELLLVKKSRGIDMARDQEFLTPDVCLSLMDKTIPRTFDERYRIGECDTFSLIYTLHENYPERTVSIDQMAEIAEDFSNMDFSRHVYESTSNDTTHGVVIPTSRLCSSNYTEETSTKTKKKPTRKKQTSIEAASSGGGAQEFKMRPYKIISSSNQRVISKNKVEAASRHFKLNFGINNPEMLCAIKILAIKNNCESNYRWFFNRFNTKKRGSTSTTQIKKENAPSTSSSVESA